MPLRTPLGFRIVEVGAFVAVPFAGQMLGLLGADVVRVDPIGGGLDFQRWPVTENGTSLYWLGLNRMKRSFEADLSDDHVQTIVRELVVSGGDLGGILITNLSPKWLSYERLHSLRKDVIVVEVEGNPDGSIAVDYTVNSAVGFPNVTGDSRAPVNHVLPAWDLLAGSMTALAVVHAEASRRITGEGAHIKIALSDVAFMATASLGFLADVEINNHDREADGNFLYGSYGKDFTTLDGQSVMVVAITPRQWNALLSVTGCHETMSDLEAQLGVNLSDEGERFNARHEITEKLRPWFSCRPISEVRSALDKANVCWGPYQTARQALDDWRVLQTDGILTPVHQPGVGTMLAPRSPIRIEGRLDPRETHALGADTEDVLSRVLGLDSEAIELLRASGKV